MYFSCNSLLTSSLCLPQHTSALCWCWYSRRSSVPWVLGAHDAWWCVLLFFSPFSSGRVSRWWWRGWCSGGRPVVDKLQKSAGRIWVLPSAGSYSLGTLRFVGSCMLQHIMLIAGLWEAFSMNKCSVVWSFSFFQDGESGFFCLICFWGWLVLCLFL